MGRTTLYDWFGSRDGLLAKAFAHAARLALFRIRSQVTTTGAPAILETFPHYDGTVATHPAITGFLRADPATTIRMVTDPSGALHRTHVATFEELIARPHSFSVAEALGRWVRAASQMRSSARVAVSALGGPDTGGT